MTRFDFSPGRARAVRITTALALALACASVFGSASASAASPSTVELTCGPVEPVVGNTASCKTVVSSPVGRPGRTVRFERFGFAEFPSGGSCQLLPLSKNSSFCVFRFRLTGPGPVRLFASYGDDPNFEFSSDAHEFFVKAGGSINVECSPEFGFVDEPSTCEAFVPNTPGVSEPPSGTLHFHATDLVEDETRAFLFPECGLEAVPGGARCAVTFMPFFAGEYAVYADYEGDTSHPVQFGSLFYPVFEKHETKTSAKCDNPTPEKGITMRCTVSVASLDGTGGPPTGTVEFREEDEAGNFPPPSTGPFCELKADETEEEKASESFCSVLYKPTKVGPQVLEVQFLGSERFDFGEPAFIELDVQPVPRQRETRTSAKCDELTPLVNSTLTCTVSVVNLEETGGPPTGLLDISQGGFINGDLAPSICELKATDLSGNESFCTFFYRPRKVGPHVLTVKYRGDDRFKAATASTAIDLTVVGPRQTRTGVTCLASRGTFPGVCLVTVSDISATPSRPGGVVRLIVPETVKLNRETCDLTPSATSTTSSTCSFGYTMTAIGSATVTTDYDGDEKGHLPSIGKGTASRTS